MEPNCLEKMTNLIIEKQSEIVITNFNVFLEDDPSKEDKYLNNYLDMESKYLNVDDIVDIVDVISLVNHILYNNSQNLTLFERHKLDINTDSFINIQDITGIINIILE